MMKRFILKLLLIFSVYVPNLTTAGINYYSNLDFIDTTFIFKESGNYEFNAGVNFNYTPVDTATGSPMIKIVASNFFLNGSNAGLSNLNNSELGFVAIEIGWSPAELAADPTRVQPNNINISNLGINKFGVGIIIHKGVDHVIFNNINIFNSCIGIAALGLSTGIIRDLYFDTVSIIGCRRNCYAMVADTKAYIETTCGYGADYFMKAVADPYNSNTVDVLSYYGIWVNYVHKIHVSDLAIQDIGYNYIDNGSAGNGNRTLSIGITYKNSQHVDNKNISMTDLYSEIKAVGLLLDNLSSISIENSDFSYCNSQKTAMGIQVTNDTAADYSVLALKMDNLNTQNHFSDDITIGMDLSSVQGLRATNLSSKFNKGSNNCYGLYIDKGSTVNIQDSTFSENVATRQTNDVATTFGIAGYGFYGNNINGMQIINVDFNNTQALNSAYGIYLNNSNSILFTDCQFVGNICTQMRSGEAADIRTQQDTQEISKHAPVVTATSTGAYGASLVSTNYVKFQNCLANSNKGHRAIGLKFNGCRAVAIYDSFVSTQYATGSMIDTSFQTDNIANPSAIAIKSPHIPLFFGGLQKTTIDALTTTDIFLEKMSSIRASQVAGNDPSYSDVIAATSTLSLLEGMIARYRLWGVGIGIHAHNVSGFLLRNCTSAGNLSLFDSGIGVCFTGRNTDHTVSNSNLLFNLGSLASIVTATTNPLADYAYSYNLMNVKPFWSTLLQTDVWTNITNNSLGSAVNSVAISPNGNYLAVGLANNNVVILNPNTGATVTTLSGHTAAITSVAFSPDGTKLATGSASATDNIKIWETTGWTNTQTLTHISSGVYSIAWNPAGTQLASGAEAVISLNNIAIWNTTTWAQSQLLTQGILGVRVTSLSYSPDGTMLASGSDDTTNNIKIWETAGWTNTQTLNQHTDAVTSLAFNPAGTLLASGSKDDLIKIWSTSGWTVSQTITASAGDVNAVGFKNDGKLLASAHADNSLRVWLTTDWSSVQTFTDHTQAATSLAWSADGRRIASGSLDGYAKFYSTNIFSKATTTTQAGIYNPSIYFTAQGQKDYGNESSGNDVFVRLKSQDRALISPVGPVGAGIIMGDLLLEGVVENSNLYGNLGNAGYASGVILDNAYSVTIDSNVIAGNIANVYGTAAGIYDRTAHSPNLFMKNFLEGNKCSIFNNSNYFIPFNPADANNLSLPITKMMNGKFLNVTTLMDNIEMQYSQNSQFYSIEYLASVPQHPDIVSYWTTNSCWA